MCGIAHGGMLVTLADWLEARCSGVFAVVEPLVTRKSPRDKAVVRQ